MTLLHFEFRSVRAVMIHYTAAFRFALDSAIGLFGLNRSSRSSIVITIRYYSSDSSWLWLRYCVPGCSTFVLCGSSRRLRTAYCSLCHRVAVAAHHPHALPRCAHPHHTAIYTLMSVRLPDATTGLLPFRLCLQPRRSPYYAEPTFPVALRVVLHPHTLLRWYVLRWCAAPLLTLPGVTQALRGGTNDYLSSPHPHEPLVRCIRAHQFALYALPYITFPPPTVTVLVCAFCWTTTFSVTVLLPDCYCSICYRCADRCLLDYVFVCRTLFTILGCARSYLLVRVLSYYRYIIYYFYSPFICILKHYSWPLIIIWWILPVWFIRCYSGLFRFALVRTCRFTRFCIMDCARVCRCVLDFLTNC